MSTAFNSQTISCSTNTSILNPSSNTNHHNEPEDKLVGQNQVFFLLIHGRSIPHIFSQVIPGLTRCELCKHNPRFLYTAIFLCQSIDTFFLSYYLKSARVSLDLQKIELIVSPSSRHAAFHFIIAERQEDGKSFIEFTKTRLRVLPVFRHLTADFSLIAVMRKQIIYAE